MDVAPDGEEGLFRAQSNDYDLIVLDVLRPKKDGFQVLRELRAAKCRARIHTGRGAGYVLKTAGEAVQ